ncbi:MAG: type IV toxin-antitoxin system AbiEi family antitoxin domain-containing protein, partial [Phycisphaerae bacterium]
VRFSLAMKRSSKESQTKLFAIAEGQGGFFTAKQAAEAGFDRTHHAYHVRVGNWQREHRGIYRLTQFPIPERPDLILWSLWSRNREDQAQGIYSHQTALSIYDLSDLMPAKLHMTVPHNFRRSAQIPPILVLHFDDVPADEVEEREGYRITRPIRAVVDASKEVSADLLSQAFSEARTRGLITEIDIEHYSDRLPSFLLGQDKHRKAA